jgi:putative acetyltransferase
MRQEDRSMPEPVVFGSCRQGVQYTDRPAAYAVIAGENDTVAAVQGPRGMIGLPGGGACPGETAEQTLRREVREELARSVRLLHKIGEATQYFYAASDQCHYKMSAVFFLAEFPDAPAGRGEHDLIWLPLAQAEQAFFHSSHAWAVRRGLGASKSDSGSNLIRPEVATDHEAIRHVNRMAFGGEEEARLVDALREGGYVRVSLVAERDQQVVGHILFSDLPILTKSGVVPALALAPLAVLPDYQRRGVGSALVRQGLEVCAEQGHRIVIVLGHPDYYPRFGFSAALARPLDSPFSGDHFMALELVPGALAGVSGQVQYPPPFGLPSR